MTITNEKDDGREIIKVVHNEGEDKPWELEFGDLSTFKHARAILNYPIHKFETEEKAVEVAEMLRDIVKADAVAVEGVAGELNNVQPAGFLHLLKSEEEELEVAPSLTEEEFVPNDNPMHEPARSTDANVIPVITTTTPVLEEPAATPTATPVAPEKLEVPTVEPLPPRPIQDKGTVFN